MPTEIVLSLESMDSQFFSDLKEGRKISDEIILTRKIRYFKEAVGIPWLEEIVIEISKKISVEQALVDLALNMIANWLYDRIKNANADVKIDGENVKDQDSIKRKLKNKIRSVEYYQAEFSLPNLSKEELLKSARTLSDRSVVFNNRQLPFPENTTSDSEYIDGLIKVEVQIADKEVMKLYNEGKAIYARPEIDARHLQFLKKILFIRLILSSDIPTIPEEWVLLKKSNS